MISLLYDYCRVTGILLKCIRNSMRISSLISTGYMGVSQNQGSPFGGGTYNQDYSILGSILGSPYLGKLPSV